MIEKYLPLINSFGVAFFGALLAFFGARYWAYKRIAKEATEKLEAEKIALNNRIVELERSSELLKQAVQPISAAFQAILIKELTHFHTPIMDKLLEKLGPPITLTQKEEKELIIALKKRTKDMGDEISDTERDAAMMLPMVMKRVKIETDLSVAKIQVVSIPDK